MFDGVECDVFYYGGCVVVEVVCGIVVGSFVYCDCEEYG